MYVVGAVMPSTNMFDWTCVKKDRFVLAGIACLILFHTCASAFDFAGGIGEPNDPYQIASGAQLLQINDDPNLADRHFVLVNDIDLDPNGPEGQVFAKSPIDLEFKGVLDGQNYAIRSLTIHAPERDKVGLFSQTSHSAHVKRLVLLAANVTGHREVGALAGTNHGVLTDCVVSGTVTGRHELGGLAGRTRGRVLRCSADVTVTGGGSIGGLIGEIDDGHVLDSSSAGYVLGGNRHVGGLVGRCEAFISGCSSSCTVEGGDYTGGLVGYAWETIITYSGATGDVHGQSGTGGLVGDSTESTIVGCYARGDVQGGEKVGGLVGSSSWGTTQHAYHQGHVQGHPYIGRTRQGLSEFQPDAIGGLVGEADTWDVGWIHCYAASELVRVSDEPPRRGIGGLAGDLPADNLLLGCLWDRELSGTEVCCGPSPWDTVQDVHGRTTQEMQTVDTYIQAGWNFDAHWTMPDVNDYPRLQWEKKGD